MIKKIKGIIKRNPRRSLRSIAKIVSLSTRTLRRAVHEDLGMKSFTIQVKQLLTEEMKEKRLTIGKRLLSSLKHETKGKMKVFSDEKMFTVDWKPNRRNDRYICSDISEVPVAMRTKHPVGVMVLGAVTSAGHVMPPHFFGPGEKVDADAYLNALEHTVKPWIDTVTGGSDYVFQQDSAPAHTAKRTQEWCQENFSMVWTKDMWPPNSPDLNPMDYYVWGAVQAKVNDHPLGGRVALQEKIRQVMRQMEEEEVARACSRFRPRLEGIIQAGGGYIE